MKKPVRPSLEANYLGIEMAFARLDAARTAVERANKLDDPSDAVWYRDTLDNLVRAESQVDMLTMAFQKTRPELRQWISDMEAYYKKLEDLL